MRNNLLSNEKKKKPTHTRLGLNGYVVKNHTSLRSLET